MCLAALDADDALDLLFCGAAAVGVFPFAVFLSMTPSGD